MKEYKDIKKILVPVPLTDEFCVPLHQAMHFNKAYGTEIILLNVATDNSLSQRIFNRENMSRRNRESEERLKALTLEYFNGSIPEKVSLKVARGPLIPTILKEAADMRCDLIIIRKAEKNKNPLGFLKTENADKLISDAVCPVLTISKNPTTEKINDILLPVDIFKKTSNKVAWAISIARQFGSRLHIVSVLSMDIKPEDSLSFKKSKGIEKTIGKEGIDVDTVILKSGSKSIAQTVLDYAERLNPDMLMIMTHQESVLLDNYLGSFAGDIIHKSEIPVFSVVPRKETILEGFLDPIAKKVCC
ncbi:MAG: universal stress protein [Bacteroidota bacterium]